MSSSTARQLAKVHDAEPTTQVPGRWVAALFLATLGMWMGLLAPIQILLPAQIEVLDARHKVALLGLVTALAGVVAAISSPVAGALSDRTTSRHGRRRPWVLVSALVCAVGLLILSRQPAIGVVALSWILVHGGVGAMHAALSAAVPDRVPTNQRGVVSAFLGLAMPLGLILGTLLVAALDTSSGYLVLSVLVVAMALPYALFSKDAPVSAAEQPGRSWREFVTGFRIDPRRHPDFAWALAGRFATQLAMSLATLYLLYFLKDTVKVADPAAGVAVLSVLLTVGVIATSIVTGRISDRRGRRKNFVLVSSVLMSVALTVMAVLPTWPAALVSAFVLGAGYGIYLAIDQALVTQVLPLALSRGQDLGILNMAGSSATVLAPLIATMIAGGSAGYTALYLLAAGLALSGGLLIRPIRSVN
jgi:MFS family permease